MTREEARARWICCPMCDKKKCKREADDCDVKMLEAYTDGWNDGRQDLIDSTEDGKLEKRLGNLVKDKKKLLEALEDIQAICEDITEVIV